VLPLLPVTPESIQARINKGIDLMTAYDLGNCLKAFTSCIQMVPLLAITTAEQKVLVAAQIVKIVEYLTAVRCEMERKKLVAEDPQAH